MILHFFYPRIFTLIALVLKKKSVGAFCTLSLFLLSYNVFASNGKGFLVKKKNVYHGQKVVIKNNHSDKSVAESYEESESQKIQNYEYKDDNQAKNGFSDSGIEKSEKKPIKFKEITYLKDIDFEVPINKTIANGAKLAKSNQIDPTRCDLASNEQGKKSIICALDKQHSEYPTFLRQKDLKLLKSNINEITDWHFDNFDHAMISFGFSCRAFERKGYPKKIKSEYLYYGSKNNLETMCKIAYDHYKNGKSKEFFEKFFVPYKISQSVTFTGYHEKTISGRRKRSSEYKYPMYLYPEECKKKKTCYSRSDANKGNVIDKKYVIAYANHPLSIWELQMQGSGIVDFEDGTFVRVSYGKPNGIKSSNFMEHPHVKEAIEKGKTRRWIFRWLYKNPDLGLSIINTDQSYLFFRISEDHKLSAVGAQYVNLTPTRSVAVDTKYFPLGSVMWIETKLPITDKKTKKHVSFSRLVIAQDRGSKITGSTRADIFFGHCQKSEYLANKMRFSGNMYLLIPKYLLDLNLKSKESSFRRL